MERMPMPTTESLLMPSCAVWLLAPIVATCASITFRAAEDRPYDGKGQIGGARQRYVCTIMSTFVPDSARAERGPRPRRVCPARR